MDKARQVFDLMISKGSTVNVQRCSILINGYCKGKKIIKAYKIFKEMCRMELVPDTITFNTLIDGFCKAGRNGECKNNQQLSTATFSSNLLASISLSNRILLKETEANKFEPNVVVYTVVIEGLCKAGKFESARDLFSHLSTKGVQPNVTTYTIMISGLCKPEKLLRNGRERLFSKWLHL
ncbi:pentatricopeptide repeat-containing protein At1g62720-like [Rosa rugosa]|uniref:pentatricopeptide repeat-containing protein At1g62720-like n=1 Tax=Rosa rugosa TaxID=74645 RepID=UPI002B406415|nr:pentatricopeptide repeat-containing protein At1g62720-like [Rosa rugosa]